MPGAEALFKGIGVRLLWNGVWVGAFLFVQRTAYLDAQRLSLEFVGAADAWAAGRGSSLQELVRSYTTVPPYVGRPCRAARDYTQIVSGRTCSLFGKIR